jgi:hypothetical protein
MSTMVGTEDERGTFEGAPRRHNGYYAGDFSDRPLPTGPVRELMALALPNSRQAVRPRELRTVR